MEAVGWALPIDRRGAPQDPAARHGPAHGARGRGVAGRLGARARSSSRSRVRGRCSCGASRRRTPSPTRPASGSCEDRGERPALFTRDQTGAEREYVVVVEVSRRRRTAVRRPAGGARPALAQRRAPAAPAVRHGGEPGRLRGLRGPAVATLVRKPHRGALGASRSRWPRGESSSRSTPMREAPALLESTAADRQPGARDHTAGAEGDQLALRVSIEVVPAAPTRSAPGVAAAVAQLTPGRPERVLISIP